MPVELKSIETTNRNRRPTRQFVREIEDHARAIRTKANVGSTERLDPRQLATQFDAIVVEPRQLKSLTPEDLSLIAEMNAKEWSGAGIRLPNGRLLILLNPNQTDERAAVTIVEEICHCFFAHAPSELIVNAAGFARTKFNEATEAEAYWTAAAVLVPAHGLAMSVFRGATADDIASAYGVSVDLVEFRIKVLGLWSMHKNSRNRREKVG